MKVLTFNASAQYDIKMQDGHQLTAAERKLHDQAKTMLDHAWKMHNQITSNKRVVEQSCVKYLQEIKDGAEPQYMQMLKIIRQWPGTVTAYDYLNAATLMTMGPIPALLPINTRRKIVSDFGLVEGRTGGHVCISKDTIDYPSFATLFALWTTKFTQDMVCDAISFTTASIFLTQEASFTRSNDVEGVVMLLDTDH